jgi:hypothetical protein
VQSHSSDGAAAIDLSGDGPLFLKSINTSVLRKEPVLPFIEQDEWRIVVFTDGYLNNDPLTPPDINVDPGHFYDYLPPSA